MYDDQLTRADKRNACDAVGGNGSADIADYFALCGVWRSDNGQVTDLVVAGYLEESVDVNTE